MRKKLLFVLLVVSLMAGILTGCGGKEEPKEDKNIENEQEDVEEDKVETDDNAGKVVDLGNGMMMEYPGGDDGLIEMEGEVTIIEEDVVIIEGDENVIEEDMVVIEGEVTDWAKAYEDYYARENILPENMKLSTSTALMGVPLDIVIATVGEETYMSYDTGSAAVDLYATDGKVYARTEVSGEESWIVASVTSEDDLNSLFSTSMESAIVPPEYVTACVYVEEVVEAGVTYDVLLLKLSDGRIAGEAYYYVNRETQMVSRYTMEAEGELVECLIEEISSIEIPAEAANATEATAEEILYAIYVVLFYANGM